jgi:hypothetical protein
MSHPPFHLNFLIQSPLFFPLSFVASAFSHLTDWPTLDEFNLVLQKNPIASRKNFRVVKQDIYQNEFEHGYEQRIFLKNELQTRTKNWHDFFNFCIWLTFPKTKNTINQLQFEDAKQQYHLQSKQRTLLQNRLTIFDENGIVVVSQSPHLTKLLTTFEWKELFWNHREEVKKHMRFFIIGHAIYERMLSPYIGLTAHGKILSVGNDFFDYSLEDQLKKVDEFAAAFLQKKTIEKFFPAPLLGIPGCDKRNEEESYYENESYFRKINPENSHTVKAKQFSDYA